jgi:peptidoglycan/xylan/chitin deacetylase (PgdA/CDA1 family)
MTRKKLDGHRPGEATSEARRFAAWRGDFILSLCLLWIPSAALGQDSPAGRSFPPPAHLTSEQDHQRTLDLLHISSLRRGPDGDPKSPNAANFDESKVGDYHLPDPLRLDNGKIVKTAASWREKRRPQIVADFDREIYGRVPEQVPGVTWEVVNTTREMNGEFPVVTKKLVGHVDNSSYPLLHVDIALTLSTPAEAAGPVPVILEFGLSPEFMAAMRRRLSAAQLSALAGNGPPWQQQVLAQGWGYASLIATTVQADSGDGLTEGIIGLVNRGQPRKLEDWGALRAWAWGASRALDYFETERSVDAKHVGIEGLSRYGKAALVSMAYDPRFAIAFVGSSGAGGAKILRRTFGEQVENLASTAEYHWMAGNFLKYAGPLTPQDLPVDAHELIALCAPRPVLISSGSQAVEGGWVDAKGMFLAAVGAGPVYKLLGKRDLGRSEFPPMETALIDGDLAFRQHSGGHTTGPNWPTFLSFAGRYIKVQPAAAEKRAEENNPLGAPAPQVALTFDDLPVHGPLPEGLDRAGIAKSIIKALQEAHAPPVFGFVNAGQLAQDPSAWQVLQLWRDAGFPLGNHTFSHMDLDVNSAETFEQDLLADEPVLQKFMGDQDWRWLRFPFLHEGDNLDKSRAIAAFLQQHHYQVAPVTLSFGDYNYNQPYARCVAKNDQPGVELLQQSYLRAASASLAQGQKMASLLYGRDIKHVMLLHIGGFETVMLPKLLDLLNQQGFKLITLEEAKSDPAYAGDPDLPSGRDGTLLQQMMASRHIPQLPGDQDSPATLERVCR